MRLIGVAGDTSCGCGNSTFLPDRRSCHRPSPADTCQWRRSPLPGAACVAIDMERAMVIMSIADQGMMNHRAPAPRLLPRVPPSPGGVRYCNHHSPASRARQAALVVRVPPSPGGDSFFTPLPPSVKEEATFRFWDMAALDPGLAGDYASAMPPRGISAVSQPLSMPAGSAAGRSCPAGSGWRWLRSVSAPLAQIC